MTEEYNGVKISYKKEKILNYWTMRVHSFMKWNNRHLECNSPWSGAI